MRALPCSALSLISLLACSRPPPPSPRAEVTAAPVATPAPVASARDLPPAVLPAPERLVAIGDIHGDLDALHAALRLAGALGADDHWSGGRLVVVQTGDLIDRGASDREVVDAVERLSDEARRAGGALYALNGNHELMNAEGDFRYVSPHGFAEFGDGPAGRTAAFGPGGPYARIFAGHATVLLVGDTLFAHGGVLPSHVAYGLPNINASVRAFLLGQRATLPGVLDGEQSPEWLREFALEDDAPTCELLAQTLSAAHATRMVVGHTVQDHGITSGCAGRVWRIDVGLSSFYHGPTQVLEIAGSNVRVLGR